MCGHSTGYSPFQLNDFKNALVTQLAHCFVSETIDSPGDNWCIIYLSPKTYCLYQSFKFENIIQENNQNVEENADREPFKL